MEMNKLKDALLFKGMSESEITAALENLHAVEKKFRKGSSILLAGSTTDRMGLVLEGAVTIENNDIWGNKTILSHVGQGGFFAETYGLLVNEPMLVDVVADSDCRILFLRIGNIRHDLYRDLCGAVRNHAADGQSGLCDGKQCIYGGIWPVLNRCSVFRAVSAAETKAERRSGIG